MQKSALESAPLAVNGTLTGDIRWLAGVEEVAIRTIVIQSGVTLMCNVHSIPASCPATPGLLLQVQCYHSILGRALSDTHCTQFLFPFAAEAHLKALGSLFASTTPRAASTATGFFLLFRSTVPLRRG